MAEINSISKIQTVVFGRKQNNFFSEYRYCADCSLNNFVALLLSSKDTAQIYGYWVCEFETWVSKTCCMRQLFSF